MDLLTDMKVIRNILSRYDFSFSKALGQNFLIDPGVCPEMAANCLADKNTGVIEIGPGIGVLTRELAIVAGKVLCVELDKRLIPILSETLAGLDNVKVVQGDILELDLRKIIEHEFCGMDVVVCANLPYYITSEVIMRLLEEKLPLKAVTVMVQKEVAARFCAGAGCRQTGAVSVAIEYYSKPHLMFDVCRESFMPHPNVDSAVIRFDIRPAPPVQVHDEGSFFKVVKAAFSQRRKNIKNSLTSGLSRPTECIILAIEQACIDHTRRAETLSIGEFADLTNAIIERLGGSL